MLLLDVRHLEHQPCSPHFLKPPPHGRGGLPLLLDVGHLEPGPRGRHHRRVEGYQETRDARDDGVRVRDVNSAW